MSSSIVVAAANGIVCHKARSMLKEYGGSLELENHGLSPFCYVMGM